MDGKDYLDQISATSKPMRPKKDVSGLLSNKYVKWGGIAFAALLLIMIIGAFLSGNSTPKEQTYSLMLHLTNTSELIKEYQPSIKSSKLRSNSASLYSVLTDTNRQLTDYATKNYDYERDSDIDEKLVEAAAGEKDALNEVLFEAKISGFIDRIYAHKMAYEITLFQAEEVDLNTAAKDEALHEILNQSYNSLENLYSEFNDFSETN